jgi:hypothetical protein
VLLHRQSEETNELLTLVETECHHVLRVLDQVGNKADLPEFRALSGDRPRDSE